MTRSELIEVSKVPAVTLGFWLIKILATTLGETAGDTLSMTWLGETTPHATQSWLSGYLVGTAIFGLLLVVLVWLQIKARSFNPWLYWATIVASTTAGSRVALFWAAFILTRPLGATVGDYLDKPVAKGGLEFSRPVASAVLAVVIVLLILLLPQRAGQHPRTEEVA